MEKIYVKTHISGYKTVTFLKNEKGFYLVRINYIDNYKRTEIEDLKKPLEDDADYYFEQIKSLKNHLKGLG